MNFTILGCKLSKLGISGVYFEINVEIGVFRKNTVFGCSNEIVKCSQCVKLSICQIVHNSENVSELKNVHKFYRFKRYS